MANNTQWNKVKPWLIQGGLLLGMGMLFWFGIKPLHTMISARMDTIQQLDVMREFRSSEIKKLPDLEKQNELIQSYKKDLMIVLAKDDLVGFIQKLEELAVSEGVKIEIVSRDNTLLESKITKSENTKEKKVSSETGSSSEAAPPVSADKRKAKNSTEILDKLPLKHYIRLTLIVDAPYESLVRYLAKVETMPYALEILGLVIKESEKKSDESGPSFSGDFVQSDISQVDNGGGEALAPIPLSPLILSGEFDLVVYTKE